MKKETLVKFVVAAVVPGGFIIWGLHALIRNRKGSKKPDDNADQAKSL